MQHYHGAELSTDGVDQMALCGQHQRLVFQNQRQVGQQRLQHRPVHLLQHPHSTATGLLTTGTGDGLLVTLMMMMMIGDNYDDDGDDVWVCGGG